MVFLGFLMSCASLFVVVLSALLGRVEPAAITDLVARLISLTLILGGWSYLARRKRKQLEAAGYRGACLR
ncbi:MAG: hypothetical protein QNJ90_09190 [Planctomycetota bacterium]|nr:hypothetical protein [Planctomycetota bacterium]